MPPLYELLEVRKQYGTVAAVDGIDLDPPGEFVVIAGPSGSGKTTLLQLLGALDRPTSGERRFEGRDLEGMGDARSPGCAATRSASCSSSST